MIICFQVKVSQNSCYARLRDKWTSGRAEIPNHHHQKTRCKSKGDSNREQKQQRIDAAKES